MLPDIKKLNLPWLLPHERLFLKLTTNMMDRDTNPTGVYPAPLPRAAQARAIQEKYGLAGRVLFGIAGINIVLAGVIGVTLLPIALSILGQSAGLTVLVVVAVLVGVGIVRAVQFRKLENR
jgi:hypothetical protein